MLLYYLFWMFMGFTLHFYIIFGTNLLTGGPAELLFFCLFQCFEEKEYQTESQRKQLRRPRGRRARPHPLGPLVAPLTYLLRLYISTYLENIQSTTKNYFRHRNLLYPRDAILEPSSALRRRGNRPWRASRSSPRPLR